MFLNILLFYKHYRTIFKNCFSKQKQLLNLDKTLDSMFYSKVEKGKYDIYISHFLFISGRKFYIWWLVKWSMATIFENFTSCFPKSICFKLKTFSTQKWHTDVTQKPQMDSVAFGHHQWIVGLQNWIQSTENLIKYELVLNSKQNTKN